MKRPKVEVFADCFPRSISFGDVDGLVEINGFFLMLEWKPAAAPLSRGQERLYEQLTKQKKWTVLIVAGDAEAMQIDGVASYRHDIETGQSQFKDWEECNLEQFKSIVKYWADCVNWGKHP